MTSSAVTALLMIRHGEPESWANEVCHGRLDVPLSPEGMHQARRIGAHLRGARIDAIYASPRIRALATAGALGDLRNLTPVPREPLAEIDFGAFEGRRFDEIAAEHPDVFDRWMREPATVVFPDGESFDDLRRRVMPELARVRARHRGGSVAVVTHGGVIRSVLADVLGLPDDMLFRIEQSYGGMSLVEWIGDEPIVRYVNATVTD